jgi:hypothetical protein
MVLGNKVLMEGTRIRMARAIKERMKNGKIPQKISSRDTSLPSGI